MSEREQVIKGAKLLIDRLNLQDDYASCFIVDKLLTYFKSQPPSLNEKTYYINGDVRAVKKIFISPRHIPKLPIVRVVNLNIMLNM